VGLVCLCFLAAGEAWGGPWGRLFFGAPAFCSFTGIAANYNVSSGADLHEITRQCMHEAQSNRTVSYWCCTDKGSSLGSVKESTVSEVPLNTHDLWGFVGLTRRGAAHRLGALFSSRVFARFTPWQTVRGANSSLHRR
jgi:hypothetical protein